MKYKRLFEERYEGKIRGKWFRIKCPYHHENDASLDADMEKSGFHCWGCGKTGNHTELVARLERVSESTANNIISRYVTKSYIRSGKLGERPKTYKENYLDESIIEKFVPLSRSKYLNYLKSRKIDVQLAKKYDLRQGSSIEHDWEDRIVYPIRNIDGQLCSVEGRALEDSRFLRYRKWKGSKSTLGVFGIDKLKKSDYGRPLPITEGMFDCLSILTVGYPCLAMVCSELSSKQLSQIKRVTAHPIVILDGVKRGTERARKGVLNRHKKAFSKKFSMFDIIEIPYEDTDPNDLLIDNKLKKFLRSIL